MSKTSPVNSCALLQEANILLLLGNNCKQYCGINVAGNAIASIRPTVRLFPLFLRNRLTVDLELFASA